MRKFLYGLLFVAGVAAFAQPIPVEQLNQRGFTVTDMSFIYRGVRYPMQRTLDGEFIIDLGCRIDTGAVDIVFIVDNTGSMGGTISGVRANINGFISELDSRGYDYRLGGVEYGDAVGPSGGRREYDSTSTLPGAQMTSRYWGDFQNWVNAISAWGGADTPENALCAIEAGINDYDWRPDALHILIFFTDADYYECGCYSCDGSCSYCDETVANDILAGGFVLFASTANPVADGWCCDVGSGTATNWYRNTALASGGNWYTLGTSWSTIFSDVVALIDTFEVINFCVTNNTGTTINPATATVNAGACISVLSSNPQTYGPWYNGEEHCFVWRINTIEGCTGTDACFSAIISGGGYSDTISGCVFLEDCACPGPEAEPVCPPCDYQYTACPDQQITIRLWDEDSWVNTNTITLNINGTDYHFPDHLSYAGDILTFTPTEPWTHGDTIHYTLSNVQDGNGCYMLSDIDCGFIVDIRPPQITNWQPACGTELGDSLVVSFDISDDVSGINLANTYFTVNGTMYNGASPFVSYTGDYSSGTYQLSGSLEDFGIASACSVVVCFYAEDNVPSDMSGCDLCGPNDTTVCCTYYLNNPPTAEFIIPDSATWVACDPAEIYILFHDPDGDAIDSMSLLLEVWTSSDPTHITYDITDPNFNMYDETTAVFSPPAGFFSSGDTVYAQLVAGADIRGAAIDSLPIFWMFYLDYDPPVYFGHYPPPDTAVFEFPYHVYVNVFDSLSGLDVTSLQVTVNGEIAGFTWGYNSDSSVYLDIPLTMDICSAESETCSIQVCVYSADTPDTCGPNDTTDCWIFYWVFGAPWAEIQFPAPNSVVACEDSTVEMVLHGGVGPVDTMSIAITIDNGDSVDTFYITDDWLYVTYVEGDSAGEVDTVLVFAPPMGYWQDADTYVVSLISLNDIYGFPASGLPMTWVFFTDFSPPVTYDHQPPDSGVVATSTPNISFTIEDSVAGLNPDSFYVIVIDTFGADTFVDTFTTMDYPVAWDGHSFQIIADMAGYSFEDGDTVWVCVEAMQDTPTYCGPNDTTNCWYFVVSVNVPSAQWIQYAPESYVACEPETIIATITDPDGIDPTTLEFWVIRGTDTTAYHWTDGYFAFANDTLTFGSPTPWANGETVEVCIAYIEDSLGNPLPDPYCWSFTIDKAPPAMIYNDPPDGSIFPIRWEGHFEAVFVDSGSGFDTTAVFAVLCGDTFRYPVAGIDIAPDDSAGGYRVSLDPNVLMPAGEWRACSLVCIGVQDMPDYCGPNDTVYCWHYRLTPGPRAEVLTPTDGQITACADQCILIHLWDEDLPVDTDSIVVVINDDTIGWDSGLLSYSGETLMYCPPDSALWENEEVVQVVLLSAADSVGAYLQDTLVWSFSVDLQAPDTADVMPVPGDTISFGTPPICFDLTDNLSGVNWDSVVIAIDGSVFVSVDTPAVEVVGASVCFYPDSLGLRWVGGDSINVCVSAEDSPDLCAPNETTYCWTIYVEPGGPYGSVDHPFMGAWVSCEDTGIVMHILDEDGVVDSTIVISIQEGSDGIPDTVRYPDPRLNWDPATGTLIYHHPTLFGDAETVWVCILYAEDPIGNPLSPRPVCSYFYMDRYAPAFVSHTPGDGDIEYTRHPSIRFEILDSLSGLDTGSVSVEINGTSYGGECLNITDEGGGLWLFEMDTACYEFSGCDTITVHIYSTDTTDYCADNVLDTTFTFSIDCEGPHGEPIYVPPDFVSSCDGDSIVLRVWDSLPGVDPSTIVLYVSGYDTIRWGDPGLVYHGDTLVWYPSPPLPEEGEIQVVLVQAEDWLGNGLEEPVSWTFRVDRIPPQALDWTPACGETVANTHPQISIMPYDSGCGVVPESTFIVVNGDTFTYADGLISEVGGRLVFDPDDVGLRFPGGSAVSVCWHLVDCADDICPPNVTDTCCNFFVESGGPWSEITGPCERDWIGCEAETVHIVFEDEDGVVGSTIQFEVCYGPACDECDTLDVTSDGVIGYTEYPDQVVFDYVINVPPDADGERVCVHTLYAEDSLGNPITDHGHIDSFYVMIDQVPPEIEDVSPAPGETVAVGDPAICMNLTDAESGVDVGSVELTIEGTSYDTGSAGVHWDGTRLCFNPDDVGIWWTGGENVDVCVHAEDANCACPNALDTCWSFVIMPGGPVAEIVHPENGIVSACEGESIVVNLYDPQGDNIIDSTIQILIYRSITGDTTVLGVSDPQLQWDEGSAHLAFYPDPPFAEAETVYFCVVGATDTLLNVMTDTVCVQFSMDLGTYVAWNFTPPEGEEVHTRTPIISVCVWDSVTGIADSSVVLTVDGVEYTLDSPALWWQDETTLVFVPESVGVYWTGGDCFDVSLYAYDQPTPGYCEPNDSTVTWQVCVAPGGPVGTIVRPFDGAISSCPDEHIVMTITDSDGVDPATIRLVVNGDTFSVADPELEFASDTLRFYPEPPFADGEVVFVCLVAADDSLGNPLEAPVCWSFRMDLTPPWSQMTEPTVGMVRDRQQDIALVVGDSISGVDYNSIQLWVNDIPYSVDELVWNAEDSIQGGTIRFIPENFGLVFPPGESVCVRITATDTTDYCDDNLHDTTYCFLIEPEVSCRVHPNPFTPNGDNVNEFAVFDYPYMFSEDAELQIYDLRNVLVYSRHIEHISDISDFLSRSWDGRDNNGNLLPEGLYLWIIISNGEVVCNGTVVLSR